MWKATFWKLFKKIKKARTPELEKWKLPSYSFLKTLLFWAKNCYSPLNFQKEKEHFPNLNYLGVVCNCCFSIEGRNRKQTEKVDGWGCCLKQFKGLKQGDLNSQNRGMDCTWLKSVLQLVVFPCNNYCEWTLRWPISFIFPHSTKFRCCSLFLHYKQYMQYCSGAFILF